MFNFDLDKMKECLESQVFEVPDDLDTFEQFDEWLTKKIEEENELHTR